MIRRFAYCLGDVEDSIDRSVTKGIHSFLSSHPNTQIFLFHGFEAAGTFDGFVLQGTGRQKSSAESLVRKLQGTCPGLPVVTVGMLVPGCTALSFDETGAEYDLVLQRIHELIYSGKSKEEITACFFTENGDDPETAPLPSGFLKACADAGLLKDHVTVCALSHTDLPDEISEEDVPDLLFFDGDYTAGRAAACLPEDVTARIAGFEPSDDTNCRDPRIASVSRDIPGMAQRALSLLFDCVEHHAPIRKEITERGRILNPTNPGNLRDFYFSNVSEDLLKREDDLVYHRVRAAFEQRLNEAGDIADIAAAFETAAVNLHFGQIYLTLDERCGELGQGNLSMPGHAKDLSARKGSVSRMDLRALVLSKDETGAFLLAPDPKTHIYTSFVSSGILPDDLLAGLRLLCLFPIRESGNLAGYLIAARTTESFRLHRAMELARMIGSALALVRVREQLESQNRQLSRLTMTDSLTGLSNRLGLEMLGRQSFQDLQAKGGAALWVVNIDNLRLVNDTFGHLAGDELLVNIGSILSLVGHANACFVCRYAGDEFVLLSSYGAKQVEEQILQQVSVMRLSSIAEGLFTPSVSIVRFEAGPGTTLEAAIEGARNQMAQKRKQKRAMGPNPFTESRFAAYRRSGLIRLINESSRTFEELQAFLQTDQ